jgi:hypothetical protein
MELELSSDRYSLAMKIRQYAATDATIQALAESHQIESKKRERRGCTHSSDPIVHWGGGVGRGEEYKAETHEHVINTMRLVAAANKERYAAELEESRKPRKSRVFESMSAEERSRRVEALIASLERDGVRAQ